MKVNGVQNFYPNFGAQYVCDMPVKQKSGDEKEFYVVALDAHDKHDFRVLRKISRSWSREYKKYRYGNNYATDIYKDAKTEKLREHLYRRVDFSEKFYAVTSQKDGFEKLNPDKIAAVTHVYDGNPKVALIRYFQVRPKYKFNGFGGREISNIGKTFIKTINEITCKKSLVFADEYSRGFYQAIGAVEDEESVNTFTIEI